MYDISFKVKVEGVDAYVNVCGYCANVTSNVRGIVENSTGLVLEHGAILGRCVDVAPKISAGYTELVENEGKYKDLESPNGWGTVRGVRKFYRDIIDMWEDVQEWYPELINVMILMVE